MADGLTLNAGSGGATLATDDIGGVHYQITKMAFGALDSATVVTAAAGFPVQLQTGHADIKVTLDGETVTLGGDLPDTAAGDLAAINAALGGALTVNSHAVTNAGTFAVQVTSAPTTAVTGPLTDTELRATAVPVSLASVPSHAVTNAGTFAVQVTSAPTTAVTGPVTDAELRATAVPVSLASVPSHAVTNAGTFAVQATQSGAWTVDLGATDNAVLDTIASPVETISATPLQRVAIYDASDSQITSFGGGTQYTEGDTDDTITGTAMLMEGAGDALVVAPGTAADGLLVNLGSNNDVTGTVTANAGTNLNTSALALESGGNLATIAGDTTSLDGKVTACNTGAVVISSGTVTTVSSVTAIANALPAGTNAIGKLAPNSGVDIGDVDVTSMPGTAAEGAALPGVVVVVAGDDGTDTHPLQVDDSGNLKIVPGTSAGMIVQGYGEENAIVLENPLLAAGRYDSSERTLDAGDKGAVALSPQGWLMVGNQSSYLFDGVTRCQVKRASGLAASGTVAMVSAVASKKIRVLAIALFATSATVTNVYIANDDNNLIGDSSNPLPLAQDADGDNVAGFVLPWNPGGWFETDTANEALNLILSAAQDVIYALTYIEVS